MVVIRPVATRDLDHLLELAGLAGFGLTTLPRDRDLLRSRIAASQQSFGRLAEQPRGEAYLFVLEDLTIGKVVGTCGVVSKVGGFEPFYAYRIETAVHASEELQVRKEIPFLRLVVEHNGPCEIGSLFLDPDYRHEGNGRLLSLARFLFMAEVPQRFDPVVIAEMRGVIDGQGRSVFWDALGKHFFDLDFPKADYLSMVNKKFIADLMPTHPIYVPLLPVEAQAVIGMVHPHTAPALKILEAEGFAFCGMVDIFEAGPVVRCPRMQIRTIRTSVRARVAEIRNNGLDSEWFVLSNTRRDFRACTARLQDAGTGLVRLDGPAAVALGVKVGDPVRYALLRPERQAVTANQEHTQTAGVSCQHADNI